MDTTCVLNLHSNQPNIYWPDEMCTRRNGFAAGNDSAPRSNSWVARIAAQIPSRCFSRISRLGLTGLVGTCIGNSERTIATCLLNTNLTQPKLHWPISRIVAAELAKPAGHRGRGWSIIVYIVVVTAATAAVVAVVATESASASTRY